MRLICAILRIEIVLKKILETWFLMYFFFVGLNSGIKLLSCLFILFPTPKNHENEAFLFFINVITSIYDHY